MTRINTEFELTQTREKQMSNNHMNNIQINTKQTNTDQLIEAINTYFDALYYCDVELLDKVFHSTSSLFDVDEGKLLVDPIANFRLG